MQIGDPLRGHTGIINSVAFSPDGARLVSGRHDNSLRLWDAKTGQPIGLPIEGHKRRVSSVAFSSHGTRFVSGSCDQTLGIWPAPKVWPDLLCQKLTRNMSRQYWRKLASRDIDYIEQCPGLPIAPDALPKPNKRN